MNLRLVTNLLLAENKTPKRFLKRKGQKYALVFQQIQQLFVRRF